MTCVGLALRVATHAALATLMFAACAREREPDPAFCAGAESWNPRDCHGSRPLDPSWVDGVRAAVEALAAERPAADPDGSDAMDEYARVRTRVDCPNGWVQVVYRPVERTLTLEAKATQSRLDDDFTDVRVDGLQAMRSQDFQRVTSLDPAHLDPAGSPATFTLMLDESRWRARFRPGADVTVTLDADTVSAISDNVTFHWGSPETYRALRLSVHVLSPAEREAFAAVQRELAALGHRTRQLSKLDAQIEDLSAYAGPRAREAVALFSRLRDEVGQRHQALLQSPARSATRLSLGGCPAASP